MDTITVDVDYLKKLEDGARRYRQLVAHPTEARHLLTMLQTQHSSIETMNAALDQMHLQDLALAAQARRTALPRPTLGTLSVQIADKVLEDAIAVIDANRIRHNTRKGVAYEGTERRTFRAGCTPEQAGVDITDRCNLITDKAQP